MRGAGAGEGEGSGREGKDDSRIQSLESNERVHTHKQHTRQSGDERRRSSPGCVQVWGLWGDLGDSDGNTLGCGVVEKG